MKYLFLHNMRTREENISALITSELLNIEPDASIYVTYWDESSNNISDIISFNPDVILTFPLTIPDLIEELSVIKKMCKCRLCIYTTEGYMSPQLLLDTAIGFYDYPSNLIDKYIFFGREYKDVFINEHRRLGRVSKDAGIVIAGYPMYEFNRLQSMDKYSAYVRNMENYSKEYSKVVLVLTGFGEADKSMEDILICNDSYDASSNSDNKLKKAIQLTENCKTYRQKYFDMLIKVAARMPETLFILKIHPVEIGHYLNKAGYDYSIFDKYKNIEVIYDNVPMCIFMSESDAVIHYGSTACVEAYILNKPSVYVAGYIEDIFPSDYTVNLNDSDSLYNILSEDMHVSVNPNRDSFCVNYFNFRRGSNYRPSAQIAGELVDLSRQLPSDYDTYINYGYYNKLYNAYLLMAIKQYVLLNFKKANKFIKCRRLIRLIKKF